MNGIINGFMNGIINLEIPGGPPPSQEWAMPAASVRVLSGRRPAPPSPAGHAETLRPLTPPRAALTRHSRGGIELRMLPSIQQWVWKLKLSGPPQACCGPVPHWRNLLLTVEEHFEQQVAVGSWVLVPE